MTELLTGLTAIFLASSVMLLVARQLSQPCIPAYITAGLLAASFVPEDQVLAFSQIGIAFLVFLFGVRTEPERIQTVASESIASTLIQVFLAGTAGFVVAKGLGFNPLNSLYLTFAVAFSSSLVGLELIEDQIRIDLLHGRLSESIHLIQDLLAVMGILVIANLGSSIPEILQGVSQGMLLLAIALVFRETITEVLAEFAKGSSELMMLLSLSLLTGFAGIAQYLGISIVVGSFAAGIAAARFPYNFEIDETMKPLKDFFSAVFFVSLGALATFPSYRSMILAGFIFFVTALIKPLITAISLMINGYDRRTSYLTGLSLDQVSEFSLIVVIQAFIAGTIVSELFNAVVLASLGTMILSSYTTRHQEAIYRLVSDISPVEPSHHKIEEWSRIESELENHVILVGYDTQGKRMAEAMREEGEEFILIENNPEKITEARKNEENYVFGDIMDDKTWEKARLEKASLVVSTIPQMKASERIVSLEELPENVILRAREVSDARELLEQGATYVEVPDIVAAEELIDHLRGIMEDVNYREELRRRNLLELRDYLQTEEG